MVHGHWLSGVITYDVRVAWWFVVCPIAAAFSIVPVSGSKGYSCRALERVHNIIIFELAQSIFQRQPRIDEVCLISHGTDVERSRESRVNQKDLNFLMVYSGMNMTSN